MADSFRGFPPDVLAFFAELEGNNARPWWLANKTRFDESVRRPLTALLDELEPVAGPFHVFRMNRDVRFAKDKSPYKTAQGAVAEAEGGTRLYVQISASGLFVGGGMYHCAPDQVVRLRRGKGTGRRREDAGCCTGWFTCSRRPARGSFLSADVGVTDN